MNPARIERLVQRLGGREHQRDQQDRAELADRAGGEQVGAEPRPQLAAVAEDRDQGADRGGRQRRARVQEGEHHPGGRQGAADPVGEHQRQQPAPGAERERLAPDPLEVDLVAGEEEQHPEPEVGEEVDELVGLGEAEHLGPDHDPEDQLDHDHRRRQPLRHHDHGDRRQGGGQDDREEGGFVDRDQTGAGLSMRRRSRSPTTPARRSPRILRQALGTEAYSLRRWPVALAAAVVTGLAPAAPAAAAAPDLLSEAGPGAEISSAHGSGVFGRWRVDEHGMPAYRLHARPDHRSARRNSRSSTATTPTWSQVGNDAIVANAYNHGYVQLWSPARHVSVGEPLRRRPASTSPAASAGCVSPTDGRASTLYADRPAGSRPAAPFGVGYARKRMRLAGLRVSQTTTAPFGDDPAAGRTRSGSRTRSSATRAAVVVGVLGRQPVRRGRRPAARARPAPRTTATTCSASPSSPTRSTPIR